MTTDTLAFGKNFNSTPAEVRIAAAPEGGLVIGNWLQSMIARGLGWTVTVGDLTTPIQGGGALTVLDADQPELVMDVPDGTTMRPVRIAVDCETPLLAADDEEAEIVIALDRTQVSGATATEGTVETAFNMRTDIIGGSPITVVSAITTNLSGAPTISAELARANVVGDFAGVPANTFWGNLKLLYEPKIPPYIVGPATLVVYWGGTVAMSGYAQAQFVAFPSTKVTNLI